MILNENSFIAIYDSEVTVRILKPDNTTFEVINPDGINRTYVAGTEVVINYPTKQIRLPFIDGVASLKAHQILKNYIEQAIANKATIEATLTDKTRIYIQEDNGLVTVGDNELASNLTISSPLPKPFSHIKLYVNGILVSLKEDNSGSAYIADPAYPNSPKLFNQIVSGDKLYWNSSKLYPLDTEDNLKLEYLISL